MPPTHALGHLPRANCRLLASCLPRAPIAAFSTSPVHFKSPLVKKKTGAQQAAGPPRKGMKSLRIHKKKPTQDTGRRPAPGERKAIRKRIVLSNTNALEVPGLRDLEASAIGDAELENQVMGIPGPVVDQLRAVEAFKTSQGWGLFRRPAALMRREVIDLSKAISSIQTDNKTTLRRVITGERASGKTTLLLQAMSMAFLKDWVVVNFPDAKDLVINHTAYDHLAGTMPPQYVQKDYTAQLLRQISTANEAVLDKMNLSQKHNLPIPVPENITLRAFAELGAKDRDVSWAFLQALWKELIKPGGPPIMVCMDNLSYVMGNSKYTDRDFKPIHAHDFVLVRHFTDLLSGNTKLPNGGMVLAATSGSCSPKSEAMEFAIKVKEAQQTPGAEVPQWNQYLARDERSYNSLRDAQVQRLKGLTRNEARSIMEYYAASGMMRRIVDENLVSEKWTISSGGIIGELERSTVKYRM